MRFCFILLLSALILFCDAQNIGIGTTAPNASSKLAISSTNSGLLIPRMTLAQRNAISSPAIGLFIYQTDNTAGYGFTNTNGTIRVGTYGDASFFRTHHSHIINLNYIKRYIKGDGGQIEMQNGSFIDVARRKKDEFLKTIRS